MPRSAAALKEVRSAAALKEVRSEAKAPVSMALAAQPGANTAPAPLECHDTGSERRGGG